jgi:hypothetical protein
MYDGINAVREKGIGEAQNEEVSARNAWTCYVWNLGHPVLRRSKAFLDENHTIFFDRTRTIPIMARRVESTWARGRKAPIDTSFGPA